MIRSDLLHFCLIFLVFMFGFIQALHVLFVRIDCDNDFAPVIETFFHIFYVTLQQVTGAYENLHRHSIFAIQIIGKSEERTGIETMRALYYKQLRRHLEPEMTSIQSKAKSIAVNSQHSSSVHEVIGVKNKQDSFRNQRVRDSFNSFDTTTPI
ncbi:unnamed protein product [Rotaria sordida]|uniref:Uncharacterized protein n=1 Tax=Rotaria sordida TaxID=392033 RepID=A0A815WXE4_9BILA|nr:unnamed protein product [Rotaria sordida]CAF1553393.1 unnamed protein product [Rotaria sordida]